MKLTLKRDDSFKLFVDGQEAKRIGSGRDRTVFKIPGVNLVAKVDNGYVNQGQVEWETYQKIAKTEHVKHVARIYKPKKVKADDGTKYTVTLQKLVKGGTLDESTIVPKEDVSEIRSIFRTKFGCDDLHGDNIMVTKKGKVKIVDLGIDS